MTRADAWGWITVLLIVSFLFGSILSSVAAWYYKKESERKQQERREKLAKRGQKRKRDSEPSSALNDSILSDTSSDVASTPTRQPRRSKSGSSSGKKKKRSQVTVIQKVVKCFSLQQSLRTLFTRRVRDEDDAELEVFNGVRVIACASIILGNTYFYMLKGPL